MQSILSVLLLALAVASVSNAAILTVDADKLSYQVGETITLTVFGDSLGATTYGTFGRLVYRGDIVDNGTRTQRPASGGGILGTLNAGDNGVDAFSDAFNRISTTPGALTPGTLSTVTLIATALGILDVNWNTDSNSGYALHFFDLTSAPGTSVTIVPEPATAALIALGLLALTSKRPKS